MEEQKSNRPFLSQEGWNLFPSNTQQPSSNSKENTLPYKKENDLLRALPNSLLWIVIGLKCSVSFGKRLKRNERSDLSFSLKGPYLASYLSSTFPKSDLPRTSYVSSKEEEPSFLPEAIKVCPQPCNFTSLRTACHWHSQHLSGCLMLDSLEGEFW